VWIVTAVVNTAQKCQNAEVAVSPVPNLILILTFTLIPFPVLNQVHRMVIAGSKMVTENSTKIAKVVTYKAVLDLSFCRYFVA